MSEVSPLDGSTAQPPQDNAPPKGALLSIFLIVVTDLLGFGIIIPQLPFYVKVPQEQPFKVTLLFSIYSIFQFLGAPILGMISDRIGRRPVLVYSQIGSVIGYLLLGLATDIHWASASTMLIVIYVSRVIDGFTGGNISTAQAYISDVTTTKDRAKGMGLIGAAFGIGFSIGPVIGGMLGTIRPSIPGYAAAAFSGFAALLTYARLPESRRHVQTEAELWLHPSKFAPILRKSTLMQLMAIACCLMAAFVMMESTIGLFLNRAFGWGQWKVALYFGFAGIIIVIVQGGLIGRLTKKVGDWIPAIAGPALVALGMVGLTWTGWRPLVSILLIAGAVNAIGRSIHQPTMSSLISRFSDPREQGIVFGMYHGIMSLARVAGPILAGLTYPYLNNTGQFVLAGVIALAMAVWTMTLKQAHPAPEPATKSVEPVPAVE